MAIDLTALSQSSSGGELLHPRDIYSALPAKAAKYQYPRDVQTQVWDRWFERRAEKNLVVKMNTGAGKTVVGLLILRSCLNESAGPALYVAPDKYLVSQVLEEASALGIECTDDPYSIRFLSGQAILVANVYKLVNGKSVFGVGQEGVRLSLGSIVIDDAHACLSVAESQFTISLPQESQEYNDLLRLFHDDLSQQAHTTLLDITAGERGKILLVPYWAWKDKQAEVTDILHTGRDSDHLRFTWPLLRASLPYCQCTVSAGRIEISSRCLPIDAIPSFGAARRRVVMSATLADDSILVTHFDFPAAAAKNPIVPKTSSDIGDRLILVPQVLDPSLSEDDLKAFAATIAERENVVVLVPSGNRADFWDDVSDLRLTADNLVDGVRDLREGHVGLTVLVNKYDGIDLPENACRLLVIDGLPEARRDIDQLEETVLYGSPMQITRAMQRIEQGMGRGVRSSEDRCAVLLMGHSLTRYLYREGALDRFTPVTRAQYDLSQKIGSQIKDKGITALAEAVELVLERDSQWVSLSRKEVLQVPYQGSGLVSKVAELQRAAFDATQIGDLPRARAALQDAVNEAENTRVKGWLKAQLAEIVHELDRVESQLILRAAQAENRSVTRPRDGISYTRLSQGVVEQAEAVLSFVQAEYRDPNALLIDLHAYLDDLRFQPDTSARFEAAVEWVGRLLGFQTQRPDRDFGTGPDVLWLMGQLAFAVIECKNGVTGGTISKNDAKDISGHMDWFGESYDASCKAAPVLIHPSRVLHSTASEREGLRVVDVESLSKLKTALMRFGTTLATAPRPLTVTTIGAALHENGFTAESILRTYARKVRR